MKELVLCVDDNPNILWLYKNNFKKQFIIKTAQTPKEAIEIISNEGSFAVVVTDLKMPGMNGVDFLIRVKELSPDTVRILLSGQMDLDVAITAVNKGNIFRLLVKPCATEALSDYIAAGVQQHRLIRAEKEIMEKTLTASMKMLIEIMSMINPLALSKSTRIKNYTKHICRVLGIKNDWQFELAAVLSQLGCVTLPQEVLGKLLSGQELTSEEQELYSIHPSIGSKLIKKIPRLETVAQMIEKQHKPLSSFTPAEKLMEEGRVLIGAQMLKVSLDFDELILKGNTQEETIAKLKKSASRYHPKHIRALESLDIYNDRPPIKKLSLENVQIGMIIAEDVMSDNNKTLATKGQEITFSILQNLRNAARSSELQKPIAIQT